MILVKLLSDLVPTQWNGFNTNISFFTLYFIKKLIQTNEKVRNKISQMKKIIINFILTLAPLAVVGFSGGIPVEMGWVVM